MPSATLVKVTCSIFNVNDWVSSSMHCDKKQISKVASLQQLIPHDFDANDHVNKPQFDHYRVIYIVFI